MLVDTLKKITNIRYSAVEKRLTVVYSDNSLVTYEDVPESVYKKIQNNGQMINESIGNILSQYKKIESV